MKLVSGKEADLITYDPQTQLLPERCSELPVDLARC